MTEPIEVSIDEVRGLVAERQRYDEWLDALAARRESTPAHVYTRVHDDYVARRGDVLEKLHGFVDGLEGIVAELDAQVQEVDQHLKAAEDERAEAQLRHMVGEFDDAAWDEVRTRVEESLALYGEERATLEARRGDVNELLEKARPEPLPEPVPEQAPVEMDGAEAPVAVALVDGAIPEVADDSIAATGARHGAHDGEPTSDEAAMAAVDATVVPIDLAAELMQDEAIAAADAAAAEAAASSADEAHAGHDDGEQSGIAARDDQSSPASGSPMIRGHTLDGLVVVEEEEARPPRGHDDGDGTETLAGLLDGDDEPADVFGAAVAPERVDGAGAPAASASQGGARPVVAPDEGEEATREDSFDDLAFLRSVVDPSSAGSEPSAPTARTGEPQKTLRCTECGTMNLPTEWYCERCGGELAAF